MSRVRVRGPAVAATASGQSVTRDPDDEALRFLVDLPGAFADHTGTTLFEHLVGTYRVLARWGCDPDVCHAGLFHSIYGTDANDIAPLGVERRAELRAVIGERAEELVHRFHATDWSNVLADAERVRALDAGLAAIAAANLLEQMTRARAIVTERAALRLACERFGALARALPDGPAAELRAQLDGL